MASGRSAEKPGEKAGDRLLLGEIGAPHGLRGEVRLRSYTETPSDIGRYGPLEDEAGTRRFELLHLRGGPKGLIARVKGVSDREAAERLTGTRLYVDRGKLPESDEEEWYFADLIGLDAVDPSGALLGEVVAMHNFGAGDILELALAGKRKTLMLPFTHEIVSAVDLTGRRVTIDLPEGADEEKS